MPFPFRKLVLATKDVIAPVKLWCEPKTGAFSCLICSSSCDARFCGECNARLPRNIGPQCTRCAIPMSGNRPTTNQLTCGECLTQPMSTARVVAPWIYRFPIDDTIVNYKDRRDFAALPLLITPLVERIEVVYTNRQTLPQALIPIPQHWRRQLKRGFHPAMHIARHLSNACELPILHCLSQVNRRPQQKALSRSKRLQISPQLFSLKLNCEKHRLPEHIALVDDVMTTGSTIESAAKVLLKAGVNRVDAWVLARTPKHR